MARVVIEHLDKSFLGPKQERIHALHDMNLTVDDKELMVLVGPSGCGKSTTLRTIAGLEEPSDGTISIDGQIVNRVPAKDRDVAMVFQNYALYPHMTVFENLAFGLKLRKYTKAEIESRVKGAAEVLGLKTFLDRLPNALSGGERQRVALGRAIVRKPKVLLLDEPLSNLDAAMRSQMRVELVKLQARLEATMIYVTHDQVEAMTLGHRIAVLNEGVIQQVAGPLELYDRPANLFVAGFIGSPPMNFFRGCLRSRDGEVCFEEKTIETNASPSRLSVRVPKSLKPGLERLAGQEIVLGLRPEDILVKEPSDRTSFGQDAVSVAEAVVGVIEPRGAETYLHLRSGQYEFIARVPPDFRVQVRQTVFWTFNSNSLRFFDPTSQAALQ